MLNNGLVVPPDGNGNAQEAGARAARTEGPAHCETCGHVERRWRWHAGARCPACGGDGFVPLVVREDAFDYALADRSGGPAPEDRRLGLLARWVGLLHVNQLTQVLNAMKRAAASGRTVRPIGDLLIEKEWIDEARLSALLRVTATPRDPQAERRFCDVAVQNKFLRPELAEAALADQAALRRNGQQPPFVGFLLIEKEYMAEPQVAAILKAQDRRAKGASARSAARPGTEPRPQRAGGAGGGTPHVAPQSHRGGRARG